MRTDIQKREQAIRDSQSELYDSFFDRWRVEAETHAVVSQFPSHVIQALDIGSGTGRYLPALACVSQQVVALDFSFGSLIVARRKNAGNSSRFVSAAAEELPFEDRVVDLVVAGQVFQHLPNRSSREGFLREVRRVLRPGGVVVASCYHFNLVNRFKKDRVSAISASLYYRRHTSSEMKKLFLDQGFMNVQVTRAVSLPDFLGSARFDGFISATPIGRLLGRTVVVRASTDS